MFRETIGDLFSYAGDRIPVHCIASDHRMGAGIAVPMAERYGLRQPMDEIGMLPWPSCLYINGVMNMVTKKKSNDKPTYSDFSQALRELHKVCRENNVTRLVMPRIGCGLDGLDWDVVCGLIETELEDMDVLACTFANPQLAISQVRKLERLRKNCLQGIRMISFGVGPVVILGKQFDDEIYPLENMVSKLDRWIGGKDFSDKDRKAAEALLARIDGDRRGDGPLTA